MDSDLGELVSDAIGAAAKKLRSLLNGDYGRYASALHALDVVEAQLRALPLAQCHYYFHVADRTAARPRPSGADGVGYSVVLAAAGAEWMLRLDQATNALEDLVQDMEETVQAAAAARTPPRWWWGARARAAPDDAVARWLDSDDRNMTRMELTVGRLASVYLEGGALFDVPIEHGRRSMI